MMLLTFNPPTYGTFHLAWVLTTIAIAVLCCIFFGRKHDDKTDTLFIFICGLILFSSEVFKQIFYTVKLGEYNWSQFPLQFCSTPIYFASSIIFIKNKKVREAIKSFLAFCGLLAGISVMVEPSGVFWYPYTEMVLHSCLWHSLMFIMGIYLIFSKGYGKKIVEPLRGLYVLIPTIAFAILFNEVMYYALFQNVTNGNVCNAFYISSHYVSSLPILRDLQPIMPYPVFILLYIIAFVLGILIEFGIVYLIRFVVRLIKKEKT